ncbi:hypothetical protein BU16DRAFT_540127 [Lophium mytilinum]|uniref:Uncharacterized protein n=1 Tax=Lophium mytilinum TaxID=390894 RepID=A0A6A6QR65_9PEZI|nr:hypothetical protein BU16DRAFT_540127 [Lophium mytilinum]
MGCLSGITAFLSCHSGDREVIKKAKRRRKEAKRQHRAACDERLAVAFARPEDYQQPASDLYRRIYREATSEARYDAQRDSYLANRERNSTATEFHVNEAWLDDQDRRANSHRHYLNSARPRGHVHTSSSSSGWGGNGAYGFASARIPDQECICPVHGRSSGSGSTLHHWQGYDARYARREGVRSCPHGVSYPVSPSRGYGEHAPGCRWSAPY